MVKGLDNVGLVLLGAGRSERFGPADKLTQQWCGKPLARHVAETLAALPFGAHIAVTGEANVDLFPERFETVTNTAPTRGMSHSIELGVAALMEGGLGACLIALADMPLVPQEHFVALVRTLGDDASTVVATANGGRPQVPAVFGQDHFAVLRKLSGEHGARDLLRTANTVACDPELLVDIDRPEDFTRRARP